MKEEIVSFKVTRDLYEKLCKIENKSEFIRNAIYEKLDVTCPLCLGKGFLHDKHNHIEDFLKNHKIEKQNCCGELSIVCNNL